MKFKLEITMGSEDVQNKIDVARLMKDAADKLEKGKDYGQIADKVGNKIGRFYFTA